MAENIVNKSDNLEELIKDQSNRIGELETHIENMSELFDQKEQTLATELLKMRLLMSEFVKFHCCPKNITSNNSIFPLSTEEKRSICGKEQSCNTIIESNSLIVSKVENEYSQITIMEDEEFISAATQTDPITSSDDDDDDDDENIEELQLTMDTVGDLNGIDYHLEYEEITLKRSKNGKRLGLTLCYGNNDEYDTDIFVSEIEKGSIADIDGRIKVGDQILQVNRLTVNSRKEAITQFSMDKNEITILLSRPRLPDNDDSNDEDEEIANVTEADLQQIANCHRTGSTNNATLSPLPENDDGDGQLTENSGFEKDSGLSRATDSDPDLIGLSGPGQLSQTGTSDRALEHELAFLRKEMETIRLECDRLLNKHNSAEKRVAQQVQQATNLMHTIDRLTAPQSPYRQILNSTGTSVTSSPTPQYFSQQQPQQQQQQQQQQTNCSQFSPHMGYERRSKHPITNPYHPSGNPHVSIGATIGINGRLRPLQHEETSSAYNTGGDSCRSTPLKGEYAHVIDTTTNTPPRRPIHLTTKERIIEPPLSPNSENQYHTIETPMSNATTVHFRPSGSIITNHPPFPTTSIPKREKIQLQQQQIFYKPGDIMYTSPENLAETIALQQRLLRQAMVDQGHHSKPGSSKHIHGQSISHKQNEKIDPAQKYEWKVKRRSDGTCYITRKPLRNQLLKAREEQLNKERHGLSTDDDAASELKTGRFWSREERKRHLEHAREKKATKMQIAMQKVSVNPSEQMIMQLSNRKQMRRSGKQLFDKFTTLQEFLAHGSRDPSAGQIGGILSVTTV